MAALHKALALVAPLLLAVPLWGPAIGVDGQAAPHRAGPHPAFPALPEGRILIEDPRLRTALAVPAPLRFGDHVWNEERVGAGPLHIIVDRRRQIMSVVRAGHEIGTSVIMYGSDGHATPKGDFAIMAKYRDHRSSLYDVDMPFTLRLTDDGISIHAVAMAKGAVTHGCIGVPPAFAERLFRAASTGDRVEIL